MAIGFRQCLAVACTMALVACGGGSDNNYIVTPNNNATDTTDEDGTTTPKANSLEVKASSRQLPSSGASPVVISAMVKDANNNILKNVPISFAVDNNGTIEADAETAGGGLKTAKLTPGLNNPENRKLSVTVKADTKVATLDVDIVGTQLQIEGPSRLVANTPTLFTIKLQDSDSNRLVGYPVTVSSQSNYYIEPVSGSGFVTDAHGELKVKIKAATGGTDILTVSALGTSTQYNLEVSGDDFAITSPSNEIKVDTDETVTLVWKQNNVAQAGRTINLSATRGQLSQTQVTTDASGKASFIIRSNTAGGSVITAIDSLSGLSASLVREFVAITPAYLSIQAEKTIVAPEESVKISALVRDANNNPVKNQKVIFSLYDTVNGELSESQATTDSVGRASIIYKAGNSSSSRNGVIISSYLYTAPTIKHSISLTVGSKALRLVLGEDEKLTEEGIYYKKTFGVIVTDSAGNGIANKQVMFSVIPTHYRKGWLTPCVDGDKYWGTNVTATCENEDTNLNGRLDAGEDFNGSKGLDPTYPSSITSNGVTDAEGKVSVQITYPQSEAQWSRVKLTATVVNDGTEFVESTDFALPVLASDVACATSAPPNIISPYGVAEDCASAY